MDSVARPAVPALVSEAPPKPGWEGRAPGSPLEPLCMYAPPCSRGAGSVGVHPLAGRTHALAPIRKGTHLRDSIHTPQTRLLHSRGWQSCMGRPWGMGMQRGHACSAHTRQAILTHGRVPNMYKPYIHISKASISTLPVHPAREASAIKAAVPKSMNKAGLQSAEASGTDCYCFIATMPHGHLRRLTGTAPTPPHSAAPSRPIVRPPRPPLALAGMGPQTNSWNNSWAGGPAPRCMHAASYTTPGAG